MNRSAVALIIGIFVAVLLVLVAMGGILWWKISGLKEQLVQDLGKSIGAQVQITSIDLDVFKSELNAAGITLTNVKTGAPWQKGAISQATVRYHLKDLFSPTLPVTVDVGSWSIVLMPSTMPVQTAEEPADSTAAGQNSNGAKGRVQVTQLSAHEGTVEIDLSPAQAVMIHGVNFTSSDNGAGMWSTDLKAESITAGSLQGGEASAQIRGEYDKITFSNLRMQVDQGFVTGDGEMALTNDHQTQLSLNATDVPISMLVSVQWQMKLSGLITGALNYTGNDQGGSAKGQLALNHSKFNFFPGLGKMTAMVGLPDITNVEVDKATADFEYASHILHLNNIDVRKNDVTRFAGSADVDATGQVDGKIKLGLPANIIGKWPQLQQQVFTVQTEDYDWADVHVTGTPEHLTEDLTPRLLTAGMSQGGDLLNQATQKATDLFKNFMGK